MAAGTKLVLTFTTSAGRTTTHTYNYADPGATTSAVKTLCNTIITNGSIYENVPVAVKSAKTVTTSENEYDLDALAKLGVPIAPEYVEPEDESNEEENEDDVTSSEEIYVGKAELERRLAETRKAEAELQSKLNAMK